MNRIGSNAPGNIFLPPPGKDPIIAKEFSLDPLPEDLPPPSHTHLSTIDLSKLIVPEGIDLSRIPKDHPLHSSLDRLWLEVVLRAIVSGGRNPQSSVALSEP
jgi:hypothetical protein